MAIQINAAARLCAARVDLNLLDKWLADLGITEYLGPIERNGYAQIKLHTPAMCTEVKTKLSSQYGRPSELSNSVFSWTVGEGRVIVLDVSRRELVLKDDN